MKQEYPLSFIERDHVPGSIIAGRLRQEEKGTIERIPTRRGLDVPSRFLRRKIDPLVPPQLLGLQGNKFANE